MIKNDTNSRIGLTGLISTDDTENEAIEFEPARLNLMNRAVEL